VVLMLPKHPLLIAVLDDEPQVRKALTRLLRSYGHQVSEFAEGRSFLLSCMDNHFDCLLLDLHMPAMSGFDVLKALRQMDQAPPTIAITGHDVPGCVDHVKELGAVECFLKPLDQETLLNAIARCMCNEAQPSGLKYC